MEKLIKILREEANLQRELAMGGYSPEAVEENKIHWKFESMLMRMANALEGDGENYRVFKE